MTKIGRESAEKLGIRWLVSRSSNTHRLSAVAHAFGGRPDMAICKAEVFTAIAPKGMRFRGMRKCAACVRVVAERLAQFEAREQRMAAAYDDDFMRYAPDEAADGS